MHLAKVYSTHQSIEQPKARPPDLAPLLYAPTPFAFRACLLRVNTPLPSPMVTIQVSYAGHKKCDLTHTEGLKLRTDAPKDIGGDASAYSPTDLVAAGLASCILTTIGMWGERNNLNLAGMTASVEKHMSQPPATRRIARLPVIVHLPASIPGELRPRLEAVGHACPVHASLHPEVDAPIHYHYDL